MDELDKLFALKARLQMELSMGSGFVGKVDPILIASISQAPSAKGATAASGESGIRVKPETPRETKPRAVEHVPTPAPASPPSGRQFASLVPQVEAKSSPEKEEQIKTVREESATCTACGLCERRNSVVWGEGSLDARVMFIGEGPGRDEDEQGRPFVGRSGRLLTDIIEKGMQLPRSEVYITNVVKCRPPGNRDPKPEEVAACSRYLKKQIETIAPKVLVAVGGVAGCALLNLPPKSSGLRGRWHQYDGIPLRVIFHPSYLLRQRGAGNQRTKADMDTWKDIQTVMELMQ